jgi:hypothetical protein
MSEEIHFARHRRGAFDVHVTCITRAIGCCLPAGRCLWSILGPFGGALEATSPIFRFKRHARSWARNKLSNFNVSLRSEEAFVGTSAVQCRKLGSLFAKQLCSAPMLFWIRATQGWS